MPPDLLVKLMPQVLVHNGFFSRGAPAVALPILDPRGDSVLHILRIGDYLHFTTFLQGAKALDCSAQLHTIVGGVRLGAVHFFLQLTVAENTRPPAGTRISETSAIGDELNLLCWDWFGWYCFHLWAESETRWPSIRRAPLRVPVQKMHPPDQESGELPSPGKYPREAGRHSGRRA